eukprot:4735989-Amphidinium_carterae.1
MLKHTKGTGEQNNKVHATTSSPSSNVEQKQIEFQSRKTQSQTTAQIEALGLLGYERQWFGRGWKILLAAILGCIGRMCAIFFQTHPLQELQQTLVDAKTALHRERETLVEEFEAGEKQRTRNPKPQNIGRHNPR